jgi:hypothetical protein
MYVTPTQPGAATTAALPGMLDAEEVSTPPAAVVEADADDLSPDPVRPVGSTLTALANDGTANYVLASARTPAVAAVNSAPLGADESGRIRSGIVNQLLLESRLNRANADPTYPAALGDASNGYRHGETPFPTGTYQETAPAVERLSTTRTNPLAIDRFSGDPVARIQQYDTDIARQQAHLQELNRRQPRSRGEHSVVLAEIGRTNSELSRLQGERSKFINDARLQSSRGENGNMYRALANPADAGKPAVIFINGVNTDMNRSAIEALEISNELNVPVHHVVNVSSMDKLRSGAVDLATSSGLNPDEADFRVQQHLTGNPPAATTAANAILDQMVNGKGPIRVIGYSQGAAIGTEALRMVDTHLSQQVTEGRITQQQKEAMLGRVRFLGVGPAADARHLRGDYSVNEDQNALQRTTRIAGHRIEPRPDLARVNYRTVSDRNDPIPQLVNVGGNGADLGVTGRAALNLQNNPQAVLPHLSYFEHYQHTDPGSVYNPQMKTELHNWFSGRTVNGNQLITQPAR